MGSNKKHNVIRLLHIAFLNSRHAATFNSCTASFSLELGIFYNFTSNVDLCPEFDKIHIRGGLLRDFYQKSPQKLIGFGLFHPERWRRDIWWVNKNGNNINQVTTSASRVVSRKAFKWLDKYSDLKNALYFLKNCPEKPTTGPYNAALLASDSVIDKATSPYSSLQGGGIWFKKAIDYMNECSQIKFRSGCSQYLITIAKFIKSILESGKLL